MVMEAHVTGGTGCDMVGEVSQFIYYATDDEDRDDFARDEGAKHPWRQTPPKQARLAIIKARAARLRGL